MSRFFVNNSYYFITVPTIKRFPFFDTHKNKSFILERINKSKILFELDDFDFSIISNHYHFVSYFNNSQIIPKLLQFINGGSAYIFNQVTSNRKPIWDEYYIYLIEDEILLNKIRGYTVGNPLKHNEVKTLKELDQYPFSSYHTLIKQLGKNTVNEYIRSVIFLADDGIVDLIKKSKS
ncbi:transposase [Patescibacteria group bacterium]|nr:transposase [Patescibacteria group bacterium]MBU1952235.1 transposase [Patescibacteria group bacterium]